MAPRGSYGFDAFVFSLKAATAGALAFLLHGLTGLPGAVWAAISAVIVTEATLDVSLHASLVRCKANLIGGAVGALLGSLLHPPLAALVLGILLTGFICHRTGLDDGLRPGYVAVGIVTLTAESHLWSGTLDRLVAVGVGCAVAVGVGYLFDRVFRNPLKRIGRYIPGRNPAE